ncbi:MAG: hypothetical protein GY772_14255, partial [bacterium]|nr:hypothetical protein [bacterium]
VGVTLISHHYEWRPNGTWLYDSLGLWVVGPMNLKKSTLLSPRCHALAGAYHPVLMDRANPRGNRGYKATAFVYKPPALAEGIDPSALADEINAIENETWQYETGSQEITRALGLEPWAPVRMHKSACAGGQLFESVKIELPHDPVLTYLTGNDMPEVRPKSTAQMQELPESMEIMPQCAQWDPLGHRWGRDSHWPLLATIGTKRYRSEQMRKRRNTKNKGRKRERAEPQAKGNGWWQWPDWQNWDEPTRTQRVELRPAPEAADVPRPHLRPATAAHVGPRAQLRPPPLQTEGGGESAGPCAGGEPERAMPPPYCKAKPLPPPPPPPTSFYTTSSTTARWCNYTLHRAGKEWMTSHADA